MKKILLVFLISMLLVCPAECVTQWASSSLPATSDSLTDWPTDVNAQWSILDSLLSNYRQGMAITYSSASTISVSAGSVCVSNSAGTARLFLKSTSATSVTFANIDTGSEASSTTYYLYAGTSTATDATPTFYLSVSSSAPTGVTYYKKLGSIYNNSSSNIDQNKIYTEPGGAPFTNTSGVLTNGLLAVYDYGTSTSSSTRRDPSSYYVCHGTVSDDSSISGLPYSSTSSYVVIAVMESGTISQNVRISSKSASGFTVGDGLGNGNTINWLTFGY